jgi:hypothetical protein
MRGWRSSAAALGVVSAALLVPAPLAGAVVEPRPVTRVALSDGTEDVWSWTEGEGVKEKGYVPAGSVPTVDMTAAVVAHRHRSVVIRARVVNLKRIHEQLAVAVINTPDELWFAAAYASPGRRAGRHELGDYDNQERRCPGMRHDFDYAAEQVELRIPRRCLDGPRWVTVTVLHALYKKVDGGFTELIDNPHNSNHMPGTTRRLRRAT